MVNLRRWIAAKPDGLIIEICRFGDPVSSIKLTGILPSFLLGDLLIDLEGLNNAVLFGKDADKT